METHLPERLGRFEIQTSLGVGAFGQVVRAYDPQLSSSVAIKILADHWAADPDARQRFLAEARHLRRVRSPSVVAVHDIGELEDGRPYFVMELADRGSFEQRLDAHGPRPLAGDDPGVARLVRGLGEGLAAIHAAGLVHRDLNPRNLLLRSVGGASDPADDAAAREAQTTLGWSLVRPDERVVIADLGLAKDVVDSPEISVVGGSAGYQAPEQLAADGELGPWSDVYAASALVWRTLTGAAPPVIGDFEGRRHEIPAMWQPLLRAGLDPDHRRRPASIEEWADGVLTLLGEDQQSVTTAPSRPGRALDECPYRGLASYEPEHASSFFGRDELTGAALERLRTARVLAVLGASGSGKSSIVRAGLIPRVRAGELPGSERWPVVLMTPGPEPGRELAYQLRRAAESVGAESPDADASGADPGNELAYVLRRSADAITDVAGGLLVCVDQFEEVFTHGDGDGGSDFVAAIGELVDPAASRVRLVVAMRADFYAEAARNDWLARRLTESQILVGPMQPSQLREAITGPAHRVGLDIEDGLVDEMLAQVGSDPGSLPLLGHALVETWRRREGRRLTIDGFRSSGGVAGAIAQTAESVFAEALDDRERAAARDLLLRLVTVRSDAAHTRRRLPLTELGDDQVTEEVVRQLVDARLLTTDDTSVQIAHEALITEWPRLGEWIDDGLDDLRLSAQVGRAAMEWIELDRDPAMLFRGTPLVTAQELAERSPGRLGASEQEFLAASVGEREQEERREAQEARRRRRARLLVGASLVSLLVVGVVAWAGIQRTRSIERSNAADDRILENLGLVARLTAETDPMLGLALGVEARALTTGPNRDAWLAVVDARRGLASSGLVELGSVEAGDALSVDLAGDGGLAAVGLRSGRLLTIDVDEGSVVADVDGHEGGLASVAFAPDGEVIATAGFDGTVKLWRVDDSGAVDLPLATVDAATLVWDVAWSPDGAQLATATENGRVQLWDAATGEPVGAPLVDALDMLAVEFSPTGDRVVASNGEGLVWGYSLPDRTPLFEGVSAHRSDIWELSFHPDGSRFATASSDGTVQIRDSATGVLLDRPFLDGADQPIAMNLRGVRYTAGGDLIAGSDDGEVIWWDPDERRLVASDGPSGGLQVLGSGLAGEVLVTLARDQAMRIWRLGSRVPLGMELPTDDGTHSVAIAPDRSFLVTGDGTGALRTHDPIDGRVTATVELGSEPIRAVAISPDGATVAAGTAEGELVVYDVATGGVARFDAHPDRVRVVAFDPTGAFVATGGKDGSVRVWALPDATLTAEFGDYRFEGVDALDWSPDGSRLAAVGFDGTADVWDPSGSRLAGPVVVDGDALNSVAFSADGTMLAIGGGEEVVSLWSAELDALDIGPFASLPDGARGVGFLDGDQILLAVAGDGTIRLWDLDSGLPIGSPLSGAWEGIRDVAVLESGPLFATASIEGNGWLWHVLDSETACRVTEPVVDRAQPASLGAGGELTACDGL